LSDRLPKIYVPIWRTPIEPQRAIFDGSVVVEEGFWLDRSDFIRRCQAVDAVLVTMDAPLDAQVIQVCPQMKVIAKYGVGVENIDVAYATSKGIPVINTPGVNASATAELALCLMLTLLRSISAAQAAMAQSSWKDQLALGKELNGKTVGLVGFGNVSRRLVEILQGFKTARLLVHSQSQKDPALWPNLIFTDLKTLLQESDLISIHKALTPGVNGFIGRPELEAIKPGAILINTSRGGLLDENALIEALASGRLSGAGLDVYESEPLPGDSRLFELDNVVMTPHIGGYTKEARAQMVAVVATNLTTLLQGGDIDKKYYLNPAEIIS
jgi:phosphoglycerate dehydrogenase-like enzyme